MMKKLLFLMFALSGIFGFAQTPELAWVKKAFPVTYRSYSFDALLDAQGNFYTSGTGNNSMIIVDSDAYISKHDSNGNLLMLKQFPGEGAALTYGRSLAIDSQGNLYLSGTFNRTVDFNPGAGVYNMTTTPQNGTYYNHDVFVCKLDPNGNFLWAKKFGNNYSETCPSMKIDSQDNLILLGTYETTMDIDPGTGVHNLESSGSSDIFVLKLSKDGNFIWAQSGGSLLTDGVGELALDNSDNIYFTAGHNNNFAWQGQSGFDIADAASLVAKMDSSGALQWQRSLVGAVGVDAINVDGNGNIVFGGIFRGGAFDFNMDEGIFLMSTQNSQLYSGYLSRLDADGHFVWAQRFPIDTQVGQIKFDANNDIYICGYHDGGTTFVGPQTASIEGFVAKLAADGTFTWAISNPQVTIPNTNNYSVTQYTALAIGNNGAVYATGNYDGFNDLNPGPAVQQFPESGDYIPGIFIEKLSQTSLGLPSMHQTNVTVYPNPGNGLFNVVREAAASEMPYTVYNTIGQMVSRGTLSENQTTVDLGAAPDGIYFMEFQTEGHRIIQKLIKK